MVTPDERPAPLVAPLRALRHEVGLSIRELEARTGLNRGLLSQYERGMAMPQKDAARIASALAQAAREGGQAA